MKRGDELTLQLERFAFEGKSIGRVDGLVVFVRRAVPGDRLRVRVARVQKQFAEAEVLEVLEPSPLRVQPRCRYAGVCGGCPWQHVEYQAQLDFKRQQVIDALERIGGFDGLDVQPALGAPDLYYYRNKMEFSFGERWLSEAEFLAARQQRDEDPGISRCALGLHIPHRFDKVLDIEECHLQSERSYRIVNAVRHFCRERLLSVYSTKTHFGYLRNLAIRESKHTGELMVNLVTSDDRADVMTALASSLRSAFPEITTIVNNITQRKAQVATGERERVYSGDGVITERIGKRIYRISANSFFQTNTLQAERLYDAAVRMAALRPDDVVFDLYSGTGTIALHVADYVSEALGIEAVPSAVEDAKGNAVANRVGNCTFVLGDLKDKLTKDTAWLRHRAMPTVVILDPPRAGIHEKVLKQLLEFRPERMVYVSCNPATQARDLGVLCKGGHYRVTAVQPVDMFPHTYHVENIVSLARTI